jgi:hypothetical protein
MRGNAPSPLQLAKMLRYTEDGDLPASESGCGYACFGELLRPRDPPPPREPPPLPERDLDSIFDVTIMLMASSHEVILR